tara:strand:- start:1899 stop:2141 length:243 start_codon:yes stop_codon:yes gene_type:complete
MMFMSPTIFVSTTGYIPVKVDHTEQAWGGLEPGGYYALMDGSVGSPDLWYYAVGSFSSFGGGIPSWGPAQSVVEVFARTN